MDKDSPTKSRWSKWRKRKRTVNEYLNTTSIASENAAADYDSSPDGKTSLAVVGCSYDTADTHLPNQDHTSIGCLPCVQGGDNPLEKWSSDQSPLDDEIHNSEERCFLQSFDCFQGCSPSCSFSDTESSQSDDHFEKELKLQSDLAAWAADSSIPLSKVKTLLTILKEHHPNLPKEPKTLLGTRTEYEIKKISGGEFFHFGLAAGLRNIFSEFCEVDKDGESEVTLQINVDGIPLFKSSRAQFWPILGRVIQPFVADPFIISLFAGEKKPTSIDEYFRAFVSEMKEIEHNGVHIPCSNGNIKVKVKIQCFICDAPARAFVKQTKLHNAYYGCDMCTQRGVWINKMTFPGMDAPLRTDDAFNNREQEEHHVGCSPLSQLSIGMVSQFPQDPMHMVYLGVVKRLLSSWIRGPIASGCRIGANACNQISASLLACHRYIPKEFPRKCRSLDYFDRWKATEFRQFILYSGFVVVRGKLPDAYYQHFLLLFVGIFCLSSSVHISTHAEYAGKLLHKFVKNYAKLYGQDSVVYNIHGLLHLASDAGRFGVLDSYSAFPFENYLGKLKKLVRKPNFVLPQVIRRLSETNPKTSREIHRPGLVLEHQHDRGPLVKPYLHFLQFKSMKAKNIFYSIADSDNCVRIGSDYGLIQNLCKHPTDPNIDVSDNPVGASEPVVIFKRFTLVESFFDVPLNSKDLGIVKVSHLSESNRAAKVSDIVCKFFKIPYKDSFVLVPLLHQFC